jgi:hypothetical protein
VRVNDIKGVAIHLKSLMTDLTCYTGSKEDFGDYACEFADLPMGAYTVTAEGIPPSVEVISSRGSFVLVEFRRDTSQSSKSEAWQGQLIRNSSGSNPATGVSSAIVVHVVGQLGQTVILRSSGNYQATCKTGTKPEYGAYACEFGGLWPAVYTVSPEGIPAEVSTYMDGVGFAEISFEPIIPTPTAPPLSPTVTIEVTPVLTVTAASTTAPIIAGSVASEPAVGWSGRVVREETVNSNSSIIVHAVGLNQQPIILRTGGWSSRAITGSKPEYGQDAVEFGALSAGDYTVELEGLGAILPVHLPEKGRLEVEFSFGPIPTPMPTPAPKPGTWTGAITSNSSGSFPRGVWSTIIIKIPGTDKMPVQFDSGGFTTSCLTGSKPEFGPGACQIGGLWPGTYKVTPQGLGPSLDVWVDGAGSAVVEFWKQ